MDCVNVTFCNSICSNADKIIKDIFGLSSLKMLAKLLKSAQMCKSAKRCAGCHYKVSIKHTHDVLGSSVDQSLE